MPVKLTSLVLLIAMFSCDKECDDEQAEMRREAEANRNKFSEVKFDSNTDLVCNMSLEEGIADTAHYNGKIYGFCTLACKAQFVASPNQY